MTGLLGQLGPELHQPLLRAPQGTPPTMVPIVEERLLREALGRQQELVRQRGIWEEQMRHRARSSHESRRSGRRSTEWEDRSSRSRSPRVCVAYARQESATIERVDWEYYIEAQDPPIEQIVLKARAAIAASAQSAASAGAAAASAGAADGPDFYMGVTRYLRRRWYGGENLEPEQAHSHKWLCQHVLSTHSLKVGLAEDALIKLLRREFGQDRCNNKRGGGGGASASKPNLLYVCVGHIKNNTQP